MKNTVKSRVEKALKMVQKKEQFDWDELQLRKRLQEEGSSVVSEEVTDIWRREWFQSNVLRIVLNAVLEDDWSTIKLYCNK